MSRIGAEGEPRLNPTLFPERKQLRQTNRLVKAGKFVAGEVLAFTGAGILFALAAEGAGKLINGTFTSDDHLVLGAKAVGAAAVASLGTLMIESSKSEGSKLSPQLNRFLGEPRPNVLSQQKEPNMLSGEAKSNTLVQLVRPSTLSGMGTVGVRTVSSSTPTRQQL